jgi:hypothetical protein
VPEVLDELSNVGRSYLAASAHLSGSTETALPLSVIETVVVEQTNVIRSGEVRTDGYYDD